MLPPPPPQLGFPPASHFHDHFSFARWWLLLFLGLSCIESWDSCVVVFLLLLVPWRFWRFPVSTFLFPGRRLRQPATVRAVFREKYSVRRDETRTTTTKRAVPMEGKWKEAMAQSSRVFGTKVAAPVESNGCGGSSDNEENGGKGLSGCVRYGAVTVSQKTRLVEGLRARGGVGWTSKRIDRKRQLGCPQK